MKSKEMNTQNREKLTLLGRFLHGSKRFFLAAVLAACVTALADMLQPQIIRVAVDCVMGGGEEDFPAWVLGAVEKLGGFGWLAEHLYVLALGVMAVAGVQVASQYAFRVFNTRASETLVKTMRDSLFSRLTRLNYDWHMKNKTGDIIQRCTSDIETMKNFLSEQLTGIFRVVILLVLSVGFMVSMHPVLTLIALIPIPAVIGYSFYFHQKVRRSSAALGGWRSICMCWLLGSWRWPVCRWHPSTPSGCSIPGPRKPWSRPCVTACFPG